jgi:uncharacterized repeat protein (TIGR04042 family)
MPVTLFEVRWPDASTTTCYSPSTVIKQAFEAGASYSMDDFLTRVDRALKAASDRVAMKYGSPCGRALGQLAEINEQAETFKDVRDAKVELVRFL